jgi:hypothetical protein
MHFGRNDVGVGGIGQILRQLATLACVNGVVIVAFQLCFLVIIVRENAGYVLCSYLPRDDHCPADMPLDVLRRWNDGARTLLPQLQLLSLLTLVNLPRTTFRNQRSASSSRREIGAPASAPLPLFSPSTSRQHLTALERGRRKLSPLIGKAAVRDARCRPPAKSGCVTAASPGGSYPVPPSDEQSIGLQEMLKT